MRKNGLSCRIRPEVLLTVRIIKNIPKSPSMGQTMQNMPQIKASPFTQIGSHNKLQESQPICLRNSCYLLREIWLLSTLLEIKSKRFACFCETVIRHLWFQRFSILSGSHASGINDNKMFQVTLLENEKGNNQKTFEMISTNDLSSIYNYEYTNYKSMIYQSNHTKLSGGHTGHLLLT